jgi:hypothetical protein
MNTYIIEVINNKAYKLLKDLEDLKIIKVLRKDRPKKKSQDVVHSRTAGFRGALKLSKDKLEDFQKHAQEIRNEWPENI